MTNFLVSPHSSAFAAAVCFLYDLWLLFIFLAAQQCRDNCFCEDNIMTLFTFKKYGEKIKPSISDMEAGVPGPGEHPAKK